MDENPYEPPKTVEPLRQTWFSWQPPTLVELLVIVTIVLLLIALVMLVGFRQTVFAH